MADHQIKIKSTVFKININNRLHKLMRELTQRKRVSTGFSIADQYELAMRNYLQTEQIPKRIEKIHRQSVRFNVTEEFLLMVRDLRLIALKKRQPLPVILEEVLERYLEKPENYLGKPFYDRNKRKLETI